jgi:hypothetical protein
MSAVLRTFPGSKSRVAVSPVQWLPGSLSATLPLFAIDKKYDPNVLYFRADDPNLYGVISDGLTQVPVVEYDGVKKAANKGRNYYSAPWAISTLPARDTGKRILIKNVDKSVYDYITALYGLISQSSPITLVRWRFEKQGYVKVYQTLQGSAYYSANSTVYFGGANDTNTEISGVSAFASIQSPLITDDFTYNGFDNPEKTIPTLRMPYNTFCAIDTPIVISAIDDSHPSNGRIYFTLMNNVTMMNSPVFSL